MNQQSVENFRMMKLFCLILQWWVYIIVLLLKSIKFTKPREKHVNYVLWAIVMSSHIGSLIVTNASLL